VKREVEKWRSGEEKRNCSKKKKEAMSGTGIGSGGRSHHQSHHAHVKKVGEKVEGVGWGKPILAGKIDLSKSRTKSTPRLEYNRDGEPFAIPYRQEPKSYTMRKDKKDDFASTNAKGFKGEDMKSGKKKLVPYDPNALRNVNVPKFNKEPKGVVQYSKDRNKSSIVFDDGSHKEGFKQFERPKPPSRLPPGAKNPAIVAEFNKWSKRRA